MLPGCFIELMNGVVREKPAIGGGEIGGPLQGVQRVAFAEKSLHGVAREVGLGDPFDGVFSGAQRRFSGACLRI